MSKRLFVCLKRVQDDDQDDDDVLNEDMFTTTPL
jgi:hypothetical protein